MPPKNKLRSKDKGKSLKPKNTTANEEPALEDLTRVLEKRAKDKSKPSESSVRAGQKEDSPSPNISLSLESIEKHPGALSSDVMQEMRSLLTEIRSEKKHHQEEILRLTAKLTTNTGSDIQWKKEGNKKQFELIQRLLDQVLQAKVMFTTGNTSKGLEKIETVVQMLNERTKLLRIADTSPHGWQTVVEYEANPIAADDEDDKKLKRAEKAAQEKIQLKAQERKAKQNRFQPYNTPSGSSYGQQAPRQAESEHPEQNKAQGFSPYRALGGFKNSNPFRPSTVFPDKPPPQRNVNSDICYNCGGRGHWAHSCPDKKPPTDKQ